MGTLIFAALVLPRSAHSCCVSPFFWRWSIVWFGVRLSSLDCLLRVHKNNNINKQTNSLFACLPASSFAFFLCFSTYVCVCALVYVPVCIYAVCPVLANYET